MTGRRVKLSSQEDPEAQDELWWGRGVGTPEMGALGGLTLYRCHHEQNQPGDYNILFSKKAYRDVVRHLKEDTSREYGGLLLGYATGTSGPAIPTVLVTHTLRAAHTTGSATRLTFTEQTWAQWDNTDEELRRLDLQLDRVGWYHSHPNIEIFLSKYDLDVCSTFSRLKCPVALVVDPIRDRGGFFVRSAGGYDPHNPKGFWEIHGEEEAGVIWRNVDKVRFPEPVAKETSTAESSVATPVPESVVQTETPKTPASSENEGRPVARPEFPVRWFWGFGIGLAAIAGLLAVSAFMIGKQQGQVSRMADTLNRLDQNLKDPKAPDTHDSPVTLAGPAKTPSPAEKGPTESTSAKQLPPKPSPTLTTLDPATVPAGATPPDITAQGTGLSGISGVRVNDKDRKLKSAAKDTAVIFSLKADDLAKPGNLKIQLLIANKPVAKAMTLKVTAKAAEKAPEKLLELSISTTSLPDATVGQAYSSPDLTVTGGAGPYLWTAEGLPKDLHLQNDGKLTGTPIDGTAGTHLITLTVTDKNKAKVTSKLNLTVN